MTQDTPKLNAFPIFMRVEGEAVVIVGDGEEALAKARLLGQSSAHCASSRPTPEPALRDWMRRQWRDPCRRALRAGASRRRGRWCSPRPATKRSTAGSPRTRAQRHTGQRRRPARSLRLLHAGPRQPRAARGGHRHRGRRPGAGADDARQDRPPCCRRRSGRWPRWPTACRDAAERLLPKGSPRRRFWNEFFTGAPARAMEAAMPTTARRRRGRASVARDGRAGPCRAGRRRSGRRRPADAARAAPADGSRRHRADALVPEAVVAMGRRDAERLPVGKRKGCHSKTPGRDQRAAGRAWPRGQARRAAEVRRSAGVRPRRRGNGGAARRRHLLRGRARRHRGLRRRRRFRTAADAARRLLVDGLHHRPRPQGRHAARLGEACHLRRDGRRLHGPLGRGRRRVAADRGRPVARHGGGRRRERQPAATAAASTARWPTCRRCEDARRPGRSGDDHHRRRRRRRQFRRVPSRSRRTGASRGRGRAAGS